MANARLEAFHLSPPLFTVKAPEYFDALVLYLRPVEIHSCVNLGHFR